MTKHNRYCAEEGAIPPKDAPFLPEIPKTVTQHVHDLLLQREKIGTAVHHRPLFHDIRSAVQWFEEALEEEADKLQYLMAAYLKLKDVLERESKGGKEGAPKFYFKGQS